MAATLPWAPQEFVVKNLVLTSGPLVFMVQTRRAPAPDARVHAAGGSGG